MRKTVEFQGATFTAEPNPAARGGLDTEWVCLDIIDHGNRLPHVETSQGRRIAVIEQEVDELKSRADNNVAFRDSLSRDVDNHAQRISDTEVLLAQVETRVTALEPKPEYPEFATGVTYNNGDRVTYDGRVFEMVTDLGSGWACFNPGNPVSHSVDSKQYHHGWKSITPEYPEFVQGYKRYFTGDKVSYRGSVYENTRASYYPNGVLCFGTPLDCHDGTNGIHWKKVS